MGNKYFTWQYDKLTNKSKYVSIKDICHSKYLYETFGDDGNLNEDEVNIVETFLGCYENAFNKTIDKLNNGVQLDNVDKEWLKIFTILQIIRTPEILDFSLDFIRSHINNDNYSDNFIDRFVKYTSYIPKLMFEKYSIFNKASMIWDNNEPMLMTTDSQFVISENHPVLFLSTYGKNVGDYNIYFPITSKHVITYKRHKEFIIKLNEEETNWLNMQIIENSKRYIYSRNNYEIRENKIQEIEYSTRNIRLG